MLRGGRRGLANAGNGAAWSGNGAAGLDRVVLATGTPAEAARHLFPIEIRARHLRPSEVVLDPDTCLGDHLKTGHA